MENIKPVNGDKVSESDQELSALDEQSEVLQTKASGFESRADKQKRKYWWKNMELPEKVQRLKRLEVENKHPYSYECLCN